MAERKPTYPQRNNSTSETYVKYRLQTYRIVRKVLVGFILMSMVNACFSYFFYTPKMYAIARDNRQLLLKYDILRDRVAAAQRKIEQIKHRDNDVYRPLFSVDTVAVDGIYTPYPAAKYASFADDAHAAVMMPAWSDMDRLA